MGAVSCRQGQHTRVSAPQKVQNGALAACGWEVMEQGGNIQGPWARGWKSLWCGVGTVRSGLEELWELQRHQCLPQEPLQPAPLLLEKPLSEWPVPQFINLFLPEFPMRPVRGQQELKILGLVAKGSFGTVLKVLDGAQKAVFAVKVVPKVRVLQRDTLRQCKEERQINHPFVHSLGDSWQGRRHLFISEWTGLCPHPQRPPDRSPNLMLFCLPLVPLLIAFLYSKSRGERLGGWFGQEVYNALSPGPIDHRYCLDFWCFAVCSYCSMDLHSLWSAVGGFPEASIRLFAAELVLVLCYLHDMGIIHRDVKMENILLDERGHLKLTDFGLSRRLSPGARAYTICGTLQYMAPEVLSGGPYNHTADWWSLGVLLFSLATGKFPVAAERDHVTMLASVTHCESEMPAFITQELSLLLHELLCQNPLHRLRHLHHFQVHPFFRGVAFDPELLKKQPVSLVVETQDSSSPLESMPFKDFDCDLESLVHSVSADSLLQIEAQLET
ncbi:ribosomal protein S6 kinase-related protein isoform X3 [Peromyscus californicus insignis]|uniref:ribosomal protein S6 kinase-related protein isoform X3 n=1 Tax=Peromyscus californicus insignis TaxID=564181 RepID=UPI0022A7EF10|nr:ribosomal protein S6 kinase-related protein isoform X3 [Peromyscus californicus insignis]